MIPRMRVTPVALEAAAEEGAAHSVGSSVSSEEAAPGSGSATGMAGGAGPGIRFASTATIGTGVAAAAAQAAGAGPATMTRMLTVAAPPLPAVAPPSDTVGGEDSQEDSVSPPSSAVVIDVGTRRDAAGTATSAASIDAAHAVHGAGTRASGGATGGSDATADTEPHRRRVTGGGVFRKKLGRENKYQPSKLVWADLRSGHLMWCDPPEKRPKKAMPIRSFARVESDRTTYSITLVAADEADAGRSIDLRVLAAADFEPWVAAFMWLLQEHGSGVVPPREYVDELPAGVRAPKATSRWRLLARSASKGSPASR